MPPKALVWCADGSTTKTKWAVTLAPDLSSTTKLTNRSQFRCCPRITPPTRRNCNNWPRQHDLIAAKNSGCGEPAIGGETRRTHPSRAPLQGSALYDALRVLLRTALAGPPRPHAYDEPGISRSGSKGRHANLVRGWVRRSGRGPSAAPVLLRGNAYDPFNRTFLFKPPDISRTSRDDSGALPTLRQFS